jgi:hypothetical protein
MCWRSLGEILGAVLDDQELVLEDEELQALVEVWRPFLPTMPPVVLASIVTMVVWGKKYAKHAIKKRREPKEEERSGKSDKKGEGPGAAKAGSTIIPNPAPTS